MQYQPVIYNLKNEVAILRNVESIYLYICELIINDCYQEITFMETSTANTAVNP